VRTHGVHETDWINLNQPQLGAGFNTPFTNAEATLAFSDPAIIAASPNRTSNQLCVLGFTAACGVGTPCSGRAARATSSSV